MINTDTKIFGVIGNPIKHSLSPIMHNAAFMHLNLNSVFLAFNVQDIEAAVSGIKTFGICGVGVTIPHKTEIIKYLDKIDETSHAIGAVNTVINKNGLLFGYNTDYEGAIKALSEKTELKGKIAAVLGAGGAARAVVFGLVSSGAETTVINRSIEKGEKLAKDLGASFSRFSDIKKGKYQIIINTTPLGMFPNIDASPLNKKYLEKDTLVMDIVYSPLKTKLLKDAEEIGCETIRGINMLVLQGAAQFELFTGEKAPLDIMKKAALGGAV